MTTTSSQSYNENVTEVMDREPEAQEEYTEMCLCLECGAEFDAAEAECPFLHDGQHERHV